jgi:hypothetical protein
MTTLLTSDWSSWTDIEVYETNWWIVCPTDTTQSMPVSVLDDPLKLGKTSAQGYFLPLEATYPIIIDGPVLSDVFSLSLLLPRQSDYNRLVDLYRRRETLLLKSPVFEKKWYFHFLGNAGSAGGSPGASTSFTPQLVQPAPQADGPWQVDVTIVEVGRPA